MTVWLVKASARVVTPHATWWSTPSTSISRRSSSVTAQVGWVSFIWKMAKSGNAAQSPAMPAGVALKRAITSCRDADTKKYCCFRRSNLPSSVASLGYRTAEISAALRAAAAASSKRPSLKAARSSSATGWASHRRRLPTVAVRKPGMGTSYAWAMTYTRNLGWVSGSRGGWRRVVGRGPPPPRSPRRPPHPHPHCIPPYSPPRRAPTCRPRPCRKSRRAPSRRRA